MEHCSISVMRIFGFDCFAPQLSQDVSPLSGVYSWRPHPSQAVNPSQRSQHTVVQCGDHFYLYGGRGVKGTHQDFWKLSIDDHVWSEVITDGDHLPPLEGHTVVEHEAKLYFFGGELSFASADEVPLWIFDPKTCIWEKKSEAPLAPSARREHVAVIYENQMCLHGGYIDLKGPSDELWMYDIEQDSWDNVEFVASDTNPMGRYKHAACVYEDYMWMCGGLMGVSERNQMQVWTWDFSTYSWCHIRTKGAPWQLYNHAVCQVSGTVFVFGGSREDDDTSSKLWKVALSDTAWTPQQAWHSCVFFDKVRPSPCANHCLVPLPSNKTLPEKDSKLFSNVARYIPLKRKHSNKDVSKAPDSALPTQVVVKPSAEHQHSDTNSTSDLLTNICKDAAAQSCDDHKLTDRDYGCNVNKGFEDTKPKAAILSTPTSKPVFVNGFQRRGQSMTDMFADLPKVQKVQHFSYNLLENEHGWKRINAKNPKFQTSSFIDVSLTEGTTVNRHSTEIADNKAPGAQINNKQLKDAFLKNASILEKLDDCLGEPETQSFPAECIKLESNYKVSSLLLVGGKLANTSLHIERPINIWECDLRLDIKY